MVLDKISQTGDIKKLKPSEYSLLASEIRRFLVKKVSVTGGHLASNLGAVELTMALHLVFDLPKDKIVWDVGHQSYTHKLLTGRKEGFDNLRCYGGMSGFPKRRESPCDAFDTGHSSTSISAGIGLVKARDLSGGDNYVISVIGDGALTGGMAYEALNNVSRLESNFIIILNDNNMSISENIGGISAHLNNIRSASSYNQLKKQVTESLMRIPVVGDKLVDKISKTKSSIKQLLVPGMFFENMGITYLGPVDGHNVRAMIRVLREAKRLDRPVVIHAVTRKGKGYRPAERNPSAFHGIAAFDPATGKPKKKKAVCWTDVFGRELCRLAQEHPQLVAVTAAMADGTGLKQFRRRFPDRFFDVGIAEGHALTFAAGMAAGGLVPVVPIYSSFLQRAYDQILHDVCLQDLPVVIGVDRGGLVGNDGETHHGLFDLSYLSAVPGLAVCAPKNQWELEAMLRFAVEYGHPIAIRYARGAVFTGLQGYEQPIAAGESEVICREREIALLAVGTMVETACQVRERLKEQGYPVTLVNVRFVSPVDRKLLASLTEDHSLLVTMEENVLTGGYGSQVCTCLQSLGLQAQVLNIAIEDYYVGHGSVDELRREAGLDCASIVGRILERLGEKERER